MSIFYSIVDRDMSEMRGYLSTKIQVQSEFAYLILEHNRTMGKLTDQVNK